MRERLAKYQNLRDRACRSACGAPQNNRTSAGCQRILLREAYCDAVLVVGRGEITSIFRLYATNDHSSAVSSMIFEIGFPAPCPALVSMRINTGAGLA